VTLTLVSGGQTGVDRGAFEIALRLGLDFGGWAPKGFRAEDGRIPEVYARRMRESTDEGYALRTRLNVQDSDATLILSWSSSPEKAGGGTWFTEKTCRQQGKQCVHLRLPRAGEEHPPEVQDGVLKWLRLWKVGVLNVAGPRESKCPGIQAATIACLRWLLEPLAVQQVDQLASEISMIDRALAAQPHPEVPSSSIDSTPSSAPSSTPRSARPSATSATPVRHGHRVTACAHGPTSASTASRCGSSIPTPLRSGSAPTTTSSRPRRARSAWPSTTKMTTNPQHQETRRHERVQHRRRSDAQERRPRHDHRSIRAGNDRR
jgi:hypothetical protein